MTIGARVTAEHGLGLVLGVVCGGQDEFNVVVVNEGHEGIVLVHGEHGLLYQVDEASLVGDVVHGGVDGDDNFAQLVAGRVNL